MRLFDAPQDGRAAREITPGDREEHPNGFTLTWHFAGTESLLMICTCNGSGTYYWARAQTRPSTCTVRDDNGLRQAWCEVP